MIRAEKQKPEIAQQIKLAIESNAVKFQAKVLDIDRANQTHSWAAAGITGTIGLKSKTLGTLLTRLVGMAEMKLKKQNVWLQGSGLGQPFEMDFSFLRHVSTSTKMR